MGSGESFSLPQDTCSPWNLCFHREDDFITTPAFFLTPRSKEGTLDTANPIHMIVHPSPGTWAPF